MRQETGLKTQDLARRFKLKKASNKSLVAYSSFGTKFGIDLSLFKPKVKIIRGKSKRRHNGVTVKIGKNPREIVPGGFMITASSGKSLVVKRKGSLRKPLAKITYQPFAAAKDKQASLVKLASADFKKTFSAQLSYELSKRPKK